MRRFAITDIHGCNTTFGALLDRLQFSPSDQLYLLGDYVDRGPDSRGVLDRIFALRENGYQIHCLSGNHEIMMQTAADDLNASRLWMMNGGVQTLDSFSVSTVHEVPDRYWAFLRELPTYLVLEDYILVHAGLDFSTSEPLDDPKSHLWLRDWYGAIDYAWLGDRIILHGHTPVTRTVIRHQLDLLDRQRYLDLDNGCVLQRQRGKGHLVAFDLDQRVPHFQPYEELVASPW